jgi:hypothetical protein
MLVPTNRGRIFRGGVRQGGSATYFSQPLSFRNPSVLSDRAGVPSVGLQPDQVHEALGHKLIYVVVVAVVYAVDVL